MSHTVCATFAVALGLVSVAAMAADARTGEPRRLIRVYDASTDDPGARAAAMLTSAELLEEAGIAADWLDCTTASQESRCRAVRGPSDLVIRIAPGPLGPVRPTP